MLFWLMILVGSRLIVVGGETGVAIPQLIVNLCEQLLKLAGVVVEHFAGVLLCHLFDCHGVTIAQVCG